MKAYNLLIILLALLCLSSCRKKVVPEPFDSTKWLVGDEEAKGKMSKDLVSSRLLIGKNKTEVLELLGTPSYTNDISNIFSYKVDLGYKYGSDKWFYELKLFFTNEKVSNVILSD
jgi:hypothetical protein